MKKLLYIVLPVLIFNGMLKGYNVLKYRIKKACYSSARSIIY
jgi:hypothetical protein